jgi:HEAT repeat protein
MDSNPMEPQEEALPDDALEPLPEVPGESPAAPPPVDFGASLGAPISDADERKMGRGAPLWVWPLLVLLLGGIGVAGFFYWQGEQERSHRWDAYNQAQEEATDPEDFLRRLREILPQTTYDDVQRRILDKFAHYRDAQAVGAIRPLLSNEDPTVRVSAARALAAIGSPEADSAKPELLRALQGAGDSDRAAILWALAVLGASEASDAIINEFSSGRLQGQPGFDPRVISDVLGPQRLSSNELINHEELSVRTLTAAALAELGTPDVIDPLTRMARFELARPEPDDNILRSIASGLGRSGDSRAAEPLMSIMTANPRLRNVVLESLHRTVGAPGIASLVANTNDASIKRELVHMLAESHDPRAADALAAQLGSTDGDIKQDAAFGLAELGDARAVPVLIELSRGEDLDTGREALSKIEHLGVPEAADGLIEMLDDESFLGRRANILRALGTTGAAHAGPAIQRHLEGDDVASAAAALADLNYEPAYSVLTRMMPRPRDVDFSQPSVANETLFMNRTAAVKAIARYGREDAAEALMAIMEDPLDDRRLRQDAGFALGSVATEDILRQALEKIRDPELDEVAKRYYVVALWQRPSRQLTNDLLDLIAAEETPPDVRRAAALAVGYAADPAADDRVSQMLANENLRREAAFIVLLGGSERHARSLLDMLGSDSELRETILFSIRDDETNAFNLLTQSSFETGELWRRLQVAHILNEGEGDNRHGYVWNHIVERLRAGWGGADGMTPRQIRTELWNALRGDDEGRRTLVARVLATMDERGLLMAARDQPGPGSAEARAQLLRLNQPQTQQQGGGAGE